jgi:sigma-B regulation protein RsbU (phosphoserine phosphatase)
MVMIRTILRLICREETSPAAALKRINDLLAIDTDPDLFATMVYGILDSAAMTFTYSSAGHCYPLHLKNGGTEVDELEVGGMILGTFDYATFESETISLVPGDEILLYTDGVTEAERKSDETFYGEERLSALLQSNSDQPTEMFCQTIETALFDFSGTDHRDDDVTIVVIKAKDEKE